MLGRLLCSPRQPRIDSVEGRADEAKNFVEPEALEDEVNDSGKEQRKGKAEAAVFVLFVGFDEGDFALGAAHVLLELVALGASGVERLSDGGWVREGVTESLGNGVHVAELVGELGLEVEEAGRAPHGTFFFKW